MAVFQKTMRKHIFLHPRDKNRRQVAVRTALLQDKNKYSDKLEGALLDVSNLKVVGDRHLVVDGYLSMEVIADFLVFSPCPGQTLDGIINKRSRSHLGCLVLDTFNASLSPSKFDPHIGDSCKFSVTEVLVDGDIMFLKGKVTSIISNQEDYEPVEETEDTLQEQDDADVLNEPKASKKRPAEEIDSTEESEEKEKNHSPSKKKKTTSPSKKNKTTSPSKKNKTTSPSKKKMKNLD